VSECWQPRYLCYCVAHAEPDPARMLETDRERWPGGVMCGYVLWIGERWREWRSISGVPRDAMLLEADHKDFDKWLENSVDMLKRLGYTISTVEKRTNGDSQNERLPDPRCEYSDDPGPRF